MVMKKGFRIGLLCVLLLASNGSWTPACAQKNFQKFLKSLTTTPFKKAPAKKFTWPFVKPTTRAALKATILTNRARQHALSAAAPLFATLPEERHSLRPLRPAPLVIRHGVFTLQATPTSHGKGSAFAIQIDGQVWGVTARHVLDDIGRSPYMSVLDKHGKPLLFQVNSAREGNIHGADIAIFPLPKEALPYVIPFQPEYTLPEVKSSIQSAGFSHGNFGWFPRIQVLFSSGHRILTRYQDSPIRSGYCGSPLLHNGKVIGVFTGVVTADNAKTSAWYLLVAQHFTGGITSFNHAVPVEWVRQLVQAPQKEPGVPLKLWGQTLGVLRPDENVHAIQQIRNDRLIQVTTAYPFMNYNHLENFFELKPGDVFRVIIHQGDRSSVKRRVYYYELHTDSKQVLIRE